ncbi:MAG: carboxymuconolactone decarboxylase family protein [Pseudomonadota bacterium]
MKDIRSYFNPLHRDASPQLASAYRSAEDFYGYLPNYFLSMSRLPMAVEAYTTFLTELYDEVTLPTGLAHLISMQASIVAGCNYSIAHAAKNASDCGVTGEKIEALWQFETSQLYNARERAALAFATKSAHAPSTLDKPDFEQMLTQFSELEICEIIVIVAQTGFHNRWNDALATPLEAQPLSFARSHLPGNAWDPGKHA